MTKGGRQLQLNKREDFFSDPIFRDILDSDDQGLRSKLDLLKRRGLGTLIGGDTSARSEAAHNLQVTATNDNFMIQLELPGFRPEDFSLKTVDNIILLEAAHEGGEQGGDEFTTRKYSKEFQMPEGVQPEHLSSSYSSDGVLIIQAPRMVTAPEGATLQEAMAAKSKAYMTDDGKTAVSEKSQASSQVIAATTESPDGRTKSSMTFSSSSSSTSSVVTTGTTGSLFSDGMSLNMDDMMKQMMSEMALSDPASFGSGGESLMSKTSQQTTTRSSSTFTEMSSADQFFEEGRRMMMRPPLGFSSVGGLDIEELSAATGTDIAPSHSNYTVTSPPPSSSGGGSQFPELTTHTVRPAANFSQQDRQPADCTVLLKLKEGNEYKLVLNMQQYSADDIVVKLTDRELTVAASAGSAEDFLQRHTVPEGIDLDQLTSTLSADGILVIKAPRK